MANPLKAFFDILTYLVVDTWEDIRYVGSKTGELFVGLVEVSTQNFLTLILASVFGGVVIYFILKYLFGSTKLFIVAVIVYIVVVVLALGLLA